MKKSLTALLGRGVDTRTAERLIEGGFTLRNLQQCSQSELENLGLDPEQRQAVAAGKRPPIPEIILIQVLHASRWRCCVCRENKPVILHHIEAWHLSRSHAAANLAVLCLDCHGMAHTKRELALNLTPERLRTMKMQWEEQVRVEDAATIIQRGSQRAAAWDFINVPRVYELAASHGVKPNAVEHFAAAYSEGVVNRSGMLILGTRQSGRSADQYFCQGASVITTGMFVRSLLHAVIANLDVVDLTSHWRRSEISALVTSGRFAWCQGLHRFRSKLTTHGKEPPRHVYLKKRRITMRFDIDPWWSLTNTSYTSHLRGQTSAGSLCLVRGVQVTKSAIEISGGCIAIGTFFDPSDVPQVPEVAWRRYAVEEEEDEKADEIDFDENDRF